MPLVAVIDPSHDERKLDQPGRLPNTIPLDELLARAYAGGPTWSPWPYELIAAALTEHQERDYFSTTLLTSACPRSSVIERKEDYIMSLDALYASVKGTLIHRTMEYAARPNSLAEARFFTTLYVPKYGDLQVSCSPDLVTGEPEATIWDWKNTENPPQYEYPWRTHTLQLQYNRYIVNHAEKWELGGGPQPEPFLMELPFDPRALPVKHLVVVYLGPKGPKPLEIRSMQPWVTPKGTETKKKQPYVWTDEQVLEGEQKDEPGMLVRLRAMAAALEAYPEWPKGLEKVWGGDMGWQCKGAPICNLPSCLARSWPNGLVW
jgi:hypothetical protein